MGNGMGSTAVPSVSRRRPSLLVCIGVLVGALRTLSVWAMRLSLVALLLGTAAVLGCHTMRFELVKEPTADVVYERKSFFLWGLTPTKKVDVLARCPNGAAAIREQMTFTDGLFSVPTLGIWSPVSSWYYCRAPHESVQP
jgi:hypothetical protein